MASFAIVLSYGFTFDTCDEYEKPTDTNSWGPEIAPMGTRGSELFNKFQKKKLSGLVKNQLNLIWVGAQSKLPIFLKSGKIERLDEKWDNWIKYLQTSD